jgi:hypothetical protein
MPDEPDPTGRTMKASRHGPHGCGLRTPGDTELLHTQDHP